MNSTLRYSVLGIFLVVAFSSMAQAQVTVNGSTMQDITGRAIMNTQLKDVEGSVFYKDDYQTATLYLENGGIVQGRKIKLNLQDNKVYYLDVDGKELESISKIKRISFEENNAVFENGFPAVDKQSSETYYQVIVSGKAFLLQCTKFSEGEYKPFNATVAIKKIDKVYELFGSSSNGISRLNGPEDVLKVLSDKAKEVSGFIQEKRLKCKKQNDLEAVIKFYNALVN